MSGLYKHLPLVNFVIASTALAFQSKVLYPWHNKLSKQLMVVENKIDALKK